MKRILTYICLGPPLGLGVLFLVLLVVEPGTRSDVVLGLALPFFLLPYAYLAGIVPALIVCAIDWLLAKRLELWPKVAVCTVVGYVATVVGMFGIHVIPSVKVALFGMVGAIPAAICSWLSNRNKDRRRA
jgi:hypothetical protein